MAGKTNRRWIRVKLDDLGTENVDISESVSSVGPTGLTYNQKDVTGYSDGWINFTLGRANAPVTVTGPYSNTVDSTMNHVLVHAEDGILGYQGASSTLTIEYGEKAAPGTPDPVYSGEYYAASYIINGADMTYTAEFVPASATAPTWSTL